jgi:hypothetical protein
MREAAGINIIIILYFIYYFLEYQGITCSFNQLFYAFLNNCQNVIYNIYFKVQVPLAYCLEM